MKKQQSGFTLIELVVVIVLLGILAVTALPKFVDLQKDARVATVNGLKAAMQGASAQVHAKSLIEGNENAATATVTINGVAMDIVYGYPAEDEIINAIDLSGEMVEDAVTSGIIGYDRDGTGLDEVSEGNCFVTYTEAASATAPPTFVSTISGC